MPTAKTLQDKFTIVLSMQGYEPLANSGKTRVFVNPFDDHMHKLYLGTSGSLRIGRNKTTSVPVSDRFKQNLLAVFDTAQLL